MFQSFPSEVNAAGMNYLKHRWLLSEKHLFHHPVVLMLSIALVLQKDIGMDIRQNALEYLGFDDSLALLNLTQHVRMEVYLPYRKDGVNDQQ